MSQSDIALEQLKQYGCHPICDVCGISYAPEHDSQSCQETGCGGVVSWQATAELLWGREEARQRHRERQVEAFRSRPSAPIVERESKTCTACGGSCNDCNGSGKQ